MLFGLKSYGGWFVIGLDVHGVYVAKVRFVGVMLHVVRCEYHDIGTILVVVLERLCCDVNFGGYHFIFAIVTGKQIGRAHV